MFCPLLADARTTAHLVQNHPVGVNLGVALRVQDNSLVGPEVRQGDLGALRTHVHPVQDGIIVKVVLTDISNAIG